MSSNPKHGQRGHVPSYRCPQCRELEQRDYEAAHPEEGGGR